MKILALEVSPLATNCYLVWEETSGCGYIIDPGDEAARIAEAALQIGQRWHAIILTHGHADHVGATPELKRLLGGKTGLVPAVYFNAADGEYIRQYNQIVGPQMGIRCEQFDSDGVLEDGLELTWGTLRVSASHTPGHTPGSMVLESSGSLFAGDLLFKGSVGRTDLPGGSWDEMLKSLKRVARTFPLNTVIYPGHGPSTTLEAELKFNGYLKMAMTS